MKKLILTVAALVFSFQVFSQSKNEILFQSVQNNNTTKAAELLKAGGDVNYSVTGTPYKTVNLLITAVLNKNLEMAKVLLENKIDVNWQDDQKCSAIIYAASTGNLEMVKLLLQHGAFINDNDGKNKSVTSAAKESGNAELITFINEQSKTTK